MNLTFVWIKNGVFGGKTCRGFRVIGVNFHICWKRACVKDLTNIISGGKHVKWSRGKLWKEEEEEERAQDVFGR